MMKKKILIIDDSALMRRIIRDIINSEKTFQADDVCDGAFEAYEKITSEDYDAIVFDDPMPGMDGLELLERLRKAGVKARIIVISSEPGSAAEEALRAAEFGAAGFVEKPPNLTDARGEEFKRQLLQAVRSALNVPEAAQGSGGAGKRQRREAAAQDVRKDTVQAVKGGNKIVALASSTGGPKALHCVIPFLPAGLDAPMILVQHMPPGFTRSMAERLNEISPISVKEAEDGDILEKGTVYIAPGGKHMEVRRCQDGRHKIQLNENPPVGGLRPCANVTFASLKDSGYDEIVCVVLTGMGSDGTDAILSLSKSKPVHVISQSEDTCVVYGMPKAVEETGIVDEVVPLTEIAQTITKNVGVKEHGCKPVFGNLY